MLLEVSKVLEKHVYLGCMLLTYLTSLVYVLHNACTEV